MYRFSLISIFLLSLVVGSQAQSTNEAGTFVGLDWENDALQWRDRDITDYYYTNGLRLSLQSQYWQRWPTRHLLLAFPAKDGRTYRSLYGFALGQEMYTPHDVKTARPKLYPYDRPYAGYIYGSWSLTTVDSIGGRRLTSSADVGIIGPVSQADKLQNLLHEWLGQADAAGWSNQLRNSLAISYAVRYDGRLFPRIHPNFDVAGTVEVNVGTVSNFAGVGGMIWLGQFTDYFANPSRLYPRGSRRGQVYAFVRPTLRAVLDNSLLQGGWFGGRENYYALPSKELTHFYGQVEYGWAFGLGGFQLTASQTFRTREFRTARPHQWGRVSLLARF